MTAGAEILKLDNTTSIDSIANLSGQRSGTSKQLGLKDKFMQLVPDSVYNACASPYE